VAIYLEATTDNRNRTASEIRSIFTKNGGKIGEPGSVAYMFSKQGMVIIDGEGTSEDAVMEAALEAGAEDVKSDDGSFVVTTDPDSLEGLREALAQKKLNVLSAEVQYIPSTTVAVDGKEAERLMRLLNTLEDQDDVDRLSANFEMSDELMEKLSA
jgi:YebC/PmpR family DNA-binding regulatory protein